jgi:hypothetical protein
MERDETDEGYALKKRDWHIIGRSIDQSAFDTVAGAGRQRFHLSQEK